MPSEVTLVFFFGGVLSYAKTQKYNAQLLVMSKKLRSQPTVSPFFLCQHNFQPVQITICHI